MRVTAEVVSPTCVKLRSQRREVGTIWRTLEEEAWRGKLHLPSMKTKVANVEGMGTWRAAFDELMLAASRIAICGVNDAAAARAALESHNQKVRDAVRQSGGALRIRSKRVRI